MKACQHASTGTALYCAMTWHAISTALCYLLSIDGSGMMHCQELQTALFLLLWHGIVLLLRCYVIIRQHGMTVYSLPCTTAARHHNSGMHGTAMHCNALQCRVLAIPGKLWHGSTAACWHDMARPCKARHGITA